ncbi:hypothetical protein, partial [uncultured Cetobacterium sp.]|uniref:hypothetical protein n=1 Tax=uncultured Cetobacterium sp. TaxID=527638 RepID=UPI00260DB4E3
NSLDVVNKIYAIGGHNLVACNIQVNKNCPNDVIVEYAPTFSQKVVNWLNISSGSQVSMRLFEDIPPEDLRTKFIKNEDTIDLHSPEQALEYAQSVLYKELTNYYSGQIIMLYEPNIRKGTEVTLLDSTNKIFGTIIVRDYHHVLDHESGMITVITPGMKIRTTSITDDIYLHGVWSKINYEMEKSEYLSTTNYGRTKNMNRTLRALTEKNREAAKMLVDTPVLLNNVSYLLKKDEKGNVVTNKVEGLRNTKELPFKIYPLIKSGIPVMPDFEIYGARSKTFQPLMNAFLAIRQRSVDRIVLAEKRAELLEAMKKRMSDIFEIGYSASLAKTADIFAGDQSLRFDEKILYEDYTDVEVVPYDKTICIFNKRLMRGNAWGFMNCAKLKFYEEDRIRNIAKIMFHFKTVSLVELDGRGIKDVTKESDFQENNFRIIERLKYYLEEFSKIYNKSCKNWVVISAHRLSTRPVEISDGEWYDDVGAFIVNYENDEAMEKFKDLGTVHVEGRSIIDGEVVVKKKKALIIKSNTSNKELFNNSLISVFHNFYGGFNGSPEIRREIYNDLKDKLKDKGHNERIVIAGDFNLQLMNGVEEYLTNDESNERVDVSSFVPMISKERTTKAGRMYDNFVIEGSTRHLMATTFRYFGSDSDDYFDFGTEYFISDHFPIFIKSTI